MKKQCQAYLCEDDAVKKNCKQCNGDFCNVHFKLAHKKRACIFA